jgi:hypothetical protein
MENMSIAMPSNAEALLVDVYLVPKNEGGVTPEAEPIENRLIALANLAVELNEYVTRNP